MKAALLSFLFLSLTATGLMAANPPTKVSPRFKARVVCFNGPVDSGSSCATTGYQPDGILLPTGKMTCGYAGKVSEIEWSFVERRGTNDVYRVTRKFPSDTPRANVTSKLIEFHDSRVIVFEDESQAVVMEPPKKQGRF